jgi:hypothetical protein
MVEDTPAEVGMALDEVDKPALIVDLDTFESNLERWPEKPLITECGCIPTPRRTSAHA